MVRVNYFFIRKLEIQWLYNDVGFPIQSWCENGWMLNGRFKQYVERLRSVQFHLPVVHEYIRRPDFFRWKSNALYTAKLGLIPRQLVIFPFLCVMHAAYSDDPTNPFMGTDNYSSHRITWSWYTGRWWMGCYIWYSEEGTGGDAQPMHTGPSSLYQM